MVLEKPDKFRPPSHPQRLNRRPPRAYNQGLTPTEREVQKTKRYPHTFPNEGTVLYRFLTNRAIHLWITLGTLTLLATISLTQSFLKTSPFGHLMPPISSLVFHPFTYISEAASVIRLHMEYTTQQTAESRRQNILDAQKRRLYRRAHGMENLDAEEEQGIDVRGLVPWDDGLTNKERERGGRDIKAVTGKDVVEAGGNVGEDLDEFVAKQEQRTGPVPEVVKSSAESDIEPVPQQKRKRKLWLGIW